MAKMKFEGAAKGTKKSKGPKPMASEGPAMQPKSPMVQPYAKGGMVRGAGAAVKGKRYNSEC